MQILNHRLFISIVNIILLYNLLGANLYANQNITTIEAEHAIYKHATIKSLNGANSGKYLDGHSRFSMESLYYSTGEIIDLGFKIKSPSGKRTMGVFINNRKISTITSQSNSWSIHKIEDLELSEGFHRIKVYDSEKGSAELDIDSIIITVKHRSSFPPTFTLLEAEDQSVATYKNAREKRHSRASGGKYIDCNPNSYIEFTYNSPKSGIASLSFRIKCNSGTRKMGLFINGIKKTVISTGKSTWKEILIHDINLISGPNTIKLDDTEATAELDVDSLKIFLMNPPTNEIVLEAEDIPKSNYHRVVKRYHRHASKKFYMDCYSNAYLNFHVESPYTTNAKLIFNVKCHTSTRKMGVFINSKKVAVISSSSRIWEEKIAENIPLNKGINVIQLKDSESTTELDVDYLKVVFNEEPPIEEEDKGYLFTSNSQDDYIVQFVQSDTSLSDLILTLEESSDGNSWSEVPETLWRVNHLESGEKLHTTVFPKIITTITVDDIGDGDPEKPDDDDELTILASQIPEDILEILQNTLGPIDLIYLQAEKNRNKNGVTVGYEFEYIKDGFVYSKDYNIATQTFSGGSGEPIAEAGDIVVPIKYIPNVVSNAVKEKVPGIRILDAEIENDHSPKYEIEGRISNGNHYEFDIPVRRQKRPSNYFRLRVMKYQAGGNYSTQEISLEPGNNPGNEISPIIPETFSGNILATEDSFIQGGHHSHDNFGDWEVIEGKMNGEYQSYKFRAPYIMFDLSSYDIKSIEDAYINIFSHENEGANYELYSTNDTWSEHEITYDNAPPRKDFITNFRLDKKGWNKIPVTNHLKEVMNGDKIMSLSIIAGGSKTYMYSKENFYGPQLVLEYKADEKQKFPSFHIDEDVEPLINAVKSDLLANQSFEQLAHYEELDYSKAFDYMYTLKDNGEWDDINYNDRSNLWDPIRALSRMLVMTYAYSKSDHPLYHDKELIEHIQSALEFWYEKNPRASNSYKNTKAKFFYLSVIGLLSEGKIDSSVYHNILVDLPSNVSSSEDQSNKVITASLLFYRGLMERSARKIKKATDAINGEIAYTYNDDGPKPDGSYLMHDKMLYNGNYGYKFMSVVTWYSYITQGSKFSIPDDKTNILRNLHLNGNRWMTHRNVLDYNVRGRKIAIYREPDGDNFLMPTDYLIKIDPSKKGDYLEMKTRINEKRPQNIYGVKHFWTSDYTSVRKGASLTTLKMCSDRILGTELNLNKENMLGYYTPFGLTYMYQHGHEYDDIFPVWDWARLPGVTSPHQEIIITDGKQKVFHENDFVGGVSDSSNGVSAMDLKLVTLDDSTTNARKSWFWFNKEWVALGAGIESNHHENIVTSINQCLLNGEVHTNDGLFTGGEAEISPTWIWHDNRTYIIPDNQSLILKADLQSGDPKRIYGYDKGDYYEKDVFSLWFDHGSYPANESYSYIVVRESDRNEADHYAKNLPIEILSNTVDLQAVTHNGIQKTGIVFYSAGSLLLDENTGKTISVNKPCIIMYHHANDRLYISDPTRKLNSVQITLTEGNHLDIRTPSFPTDLNLNPTVEVNF